MFYLRKKSWVPIVLFLLIFGAVGRFTRYYRETYASDTLLAIRDYIGLFLAGKNPYKEIVFAQRGLTPFTYLPFSLFWYLPAQIITLDLRFFEMIVSSLVPFFVFLYGTLTSVWIILPILSVISLTPFLLDLSSDGSNDNSAIFLLLLSVVLYLYAQRKKSIRWAGVSAVCLSLAATFKHYIWFYLLYFLPYIFLCAKKYAYLSSYFRIFLVASTIIAVPFIVFSPDGFFRSLGFIEIANFHDTWGWNIWVVIRDGLHIEVSKQVMWAVRTLGTLVVIYSLLKAKMYRSLRMVFLASGLTLFIYLALSNWTTYAYFTFLVPLLALSVVGEDE